MSNYKEIYGEHIWIFYMKITANGSRIYLCISEIGRNHQNIFPMNEIIWESNVRNRQKSKKNKNSMILIFYKELRMISIVSQMYSEI